jgi:hypothetical protein
MFRYPEGVYRLGKFEKLDAVLDRSNVERHNSMPYPQDFYVSTRLVNLFQLPVPKWMITLHRVKR